LTNSAFDIKESRFISSSPALKGCPPPVEPEFAFIGRSNVGKSSLINMLTNKKGLAKTSSTPGKTRMINHFLINNSWYLVDLPGYGYAKVSKDKRSEFQKSILEYIGKRDTLYCLFVLIDCRISPQPVDIKFVNWLGEGEVPFIIVFTKIDKISKTESDQNVEEFKKLLSEEWDELPPIIYTSAVKKLGRDEILARIFEGLKKVD
jgi:GTP-binding protein